MTGKFPFARREFLKTVVLGSAGGGALFGAESADTDDAPAVAPFPDSNSELVDQAFPQGVASGDPTSDGFLLWTRAPSVDGGKVDFQVSDTATFDRILRHGTVTSSGENDFTIRVRIDRLEPRRHYWYRFQAGQVSSPIGRTKTAPHPDDDVPVTIAFASCQDYIGRWYHAWRVLAERADEIDFVLFLGDYIYEYERYPALQEPQPGRAIKLPDGLVIDADQGIIAAQSLADYREIYRVIRSDRDLRRIHQLYPFVIAWDDHEHTNDAWQDHAVDFNGRRGDEQDPSRREAATRAWYEHLPVDVPFDSEQHFPDDITTWRRMRWGKHLELFLTDERYYRDDHLIAEGPVDRKAGKLLPFSPVGSRTMCIKEEFDARDEKTQRTMLGEKQRDWLITSAKASTASWKAWASALMFSPFVLDLRDQEKASPVFRHVFYFKTDQWDGFPSERKRILDELAGLTNWVVLSADLHGFYAAEIHRDPDDQSSPTVGTEFTVAGISSISLQEQIEAIARSSPLLANMGVADLASELDPILRQSSPWFVHANSRGYGVGLATFDNDQMEVEYIMVDGVRDQHWNGQAESLRFRVASGKSKIEIQA